MRVRRANSGDVSALINLERKSPSAAHWPQEQYERLCATGSPITAPERVCWVVECESGEQSDGVRHEAPEVLAFLVACRIDAEWELENIVVSATARRRGIGTMLVRELMAHAHSQRGKTMFLEVRASNHSARLLYRKVGFEENGLRKNYYADPAEDAILFILQFP